MFCESARGYVGLFRQPYAYKQYGTCMYAIGNSGRGELSIILLTPGNYMDAYILAKAPTYQDIHIFPSQLDPLFLSDTYRLVMDLKEISKNVTVHFPKKPEFAEDFEYDDQFLFSFDTKLYYLEKYNDYGIEFIPDVTIDCLTFAMTVITKDSRITIVPYMTSYMLEHSFELDDLGPDNQLHVPYTSGFYGGLSWLSMYNSKKYNMKYVVPYCFNNWEEFESAKAKSKLLPKRWGANIRDRII